MRFYVLMLDATQVSTRFVIFSSVTGINTHKIVTYEKPNELQCWQRFYNHKFSMTYFFPKLFHVYEVWKNL